MEKFVAAVAEPALVVVAAAQRKSWYSPWSPEEFASLLLMAAAVVDIVFDVVVAETIVLLVGAVALLEVAQCLGDFETSRQRTYDALLGMATINQAPITYSY